MTKLPLDAGLVPGRSASGQSYPSVDQLIDTPMAGMIGETRHYNSGGLDVNRFAMANGWDCCARDVLRYLSRHRVKQEGKRDCMKGLHYVGIRTELWLEFGVNFQIRRAIPMAQFVHSNSRFLLKQDREALFHLERWVWWSHATDADDLRDSIKALIAEYESGSPDRLPASPA